MKLGAVRLGQAMSWRESASEAVSNYDALMAKVPLIADDDARGEILTWVGRSDQIGSPAERYKVLVAALQSGAVSDAVAQDRVGQLRNVNAELGARVALAEEVYGLLAAEGSVASTPETGMGGLCLAGGFALLGLVVLPFVLD